MSENTDVMYHVRPDGEVKVCNARKRPCRYGAANRHFSSYEDAVEAVDVVMALEYGTLATWDREIPEDVAEMKKEREARLGEEEVAKYDYEYLEQLKLKQEARAVKRAEAEAEAEVIAEQEAEAEHQAALQAQEDEVVDRANRIKLASKNNPKGMSPEIPPGFKEGQPFKPLTNREMATEEGIYLAMLDREQKSHERALRYSRADDIRYRDDKGEPLEYGVRFHRLSEADREYVKLGWTPRQRMKQLESEMGFGQFVIHRINGGLVRVLKVTDWFSRL